MRHNRKKTSSFGGKKLRKKNILRHHYHPFVLGLEFKIVDDLSNVTSSFEWRKTDFRFSLSSFSFSHFHRPDWKWQTEVMSSVSGVNQNDVGLFSSFSSQVNNSFVGKVNCDESCYNSSRCHRLLAQQQKWFTKSFKESKRLKVIIILVNDTHMYLVGRVEMIKWQ